MIEGTPMGKHDTIQEVLGRRVGIFIISGIRMPRMGSWDEHRQSGLVSPMVTTELKSLKV
jgi:hypothetical protein